MPPTARPASFYRAGAYPPQDSVGYLMKRVLGSIVMQADKRLQPLGMTSTQWGPLLHLSKSGACPVAELARHLQVDAGAVTRLLDRMEKKGLCRRTRSTVDRRVVQVEITPEGRTAIADVPAVLAEVLNAHLAGFTKPEWEALKGHLQRMLENGEALRSGGG